MVRLAIPSALALLALASAIGLTPLAAQQRTPPARIWDIPAGTHVSALPDREFFDPACGTNGGPPGLQLGDFLQFAACPEDATGLREIWFSYNDENEYIGRALRDPVQIGRYAANSFFGQQVILSFLVDRGGLVQGYRIVSDPQTDAERRRDAYSLAFHFKVRFGETDWACTDLPRNAGETAVAGRYLKERCEKVVGDSRVSVERRLYFKSGQGIFDPDNQPTGDTYESSSRLEVTPADMAGIARTRRLPALPATLEATTAPMEGRAAFLASRTVHCPGCDLSGVSLRARDLTRANLAGANLRNASLHRANLRDANLTGADLTDANLNRARLLNADLSGARLAGAMLFAADAGRANFNDADLSSALVGSARMTLARLEAANLAGADLEGARLNGAILVGATLHGANLHAATLSNSDLSGVMAEGAVLTEANLRGARMQRAQIRQSDLMSADLDGADLTGADFTGSRLLSASMLNARRDGAVFSGALMPDNTLHP